MNNQNIYLLLAIMIFSFHGTINGQINQTLSQICDSINLNEAILGSTSPERIVKTNYEFSIHNGTLEIHYLNTDEINNKSEAYIYQIHLSDIHNLSINNTLHAAFYPPEKQLEIRALRNYRLFKCLDKKANRETRTELIEIPIHDASDTIQFEKLCAIINEYAKVDQNVIEALCKFDNLKYDYGTRDNLYAILNESLSKPIRLNGNKSLDEELYKVLKDYLIQENIEKFYGTIILNESDSIIHCFSFQNKMYNYFNTLDSLSNSQKIMKKTANIVITDSMLNNIVSILKKENWASGSCYGYKAVSYFEFSVMNDRFIPPEDNK